MSKEKFSFKDYWSLFKLSCRPYIYRAPYINTIRPFIAAYVLYYGIYGIIQFLLSFQLAGILAACWYFCIFVLPIINPYYFKYALHYKTSDWYLNTGYTPSEVCSDVGLFGEYHATMDYSNFKGNSGKIYNGLIIPKPDGSFTELDLVLVSEYDIAVVEVKARGGDFSGHILDNKWIQSIGSKRNELQNPVIQNQNHINFLYLYLRRNIKGSFPKGVNQYSFENEIYFAIKANVHIENPLPTVSLRRSSKKFIKKLSFETYSIEDVKLITDVLDALPKYTPEEKRQMFTKREVQYRSGEFIHPVVYYPVRIPGSAFSANRGYPEYAICMDVDKYYFFYLCEDGLWRVMPEIFQKKGEPCATLQQAIQLKKELGL